MSEETFELWKPTEGHFKRPEILEVNWSMQDGLRIGVAEGSSDSIRAWISFAPDRAFQCIDEGCRLRSIPIEAGLIWRVHNSEYIAAFKRSAAGTMDSFPLTHWLVVSGNQCVDVLSESEPTLRLTT
ncbi:MAG TPA: hypothetical protein VIU34_21650 [Steroidobacter sp.]